MKFIVCAFVVSGVVAYCFAKFLLSNQKNTITSITLVPQINDQIVESLPKSPKSPKSPKCQHLSYYYEKKNPRADGIDEAQVLYHRCKSCNKILAKSTSSISCNMVFDVYDKEWGKRNQLESYIEQ